MDFTNLDKNHLSVIICGYTVKYYCKSGLYGLYKKKKRRKKKKFPSSFYLLSLICLKQLCCKSKQEVTISRFDLSVISKNCFVHLV